MSRRVLSRVLPCLGFVVHIYYDPNNFQTKVIEIPTAISSQVYTIRLYAYELVIPVNL